MVGQPRNGRAAAQMKHSATAKRTIARITMAPLTTFDRVRTTALRALLPRQPQRILAFGDSNTCRPTGDRTRWTSILERKAPARFQIFNEGCNGRTTGYDSGECNGLGVIVAKLTAHAPLDYVIVMLGTNDAKRKYGPPAAADIAANLRQILDLIEAHNTSATPLLVTPPPLGRVLEGDLAGAQGLIAAVAAECRRLAVRRGLCLIDLHSLLDPTTDLQPDNIHLNARGRQKVADAIWSHL